MQRIAENQLYDISHKILLNLGSSDAEARTVSDHLIRANMSGHDSHGIGMLHMYNDSIKLGALKPNTDVALVKDAGAILQFDGQRGYGQRVAKDAMEAACERAKQQGLCLMTIRNAHHIGRIGTYGEQALANGLVSIHFVNVTDHPPCVAPWGGRAGAFVTNPICIAVPATPNTPETMLDMATSHIAMGKTRVAYNAKKEVAPGTIIDNEGVPTTDPKFLWEEPKGALMPTGEHKGYGLALMCEMLGGVLSGNGTVHDGNEKLGGIVNSMFTLVVDPSALVDIPWMQAEVDATIKYVKNIPKAKGVDTILTAGEPERIARADRAANGIPVDDGTYAQLQALL